MGLGQPAHEVAFVVREQAHAHRGDVGAMCGIERRVGDATSQHRARLDHIDRQRCRRPSAPDVWPRQHQRSHRRRWRHEASGRCLSRPGHPDRRSLARAWQRRAGWPRAHGPDMPPRSLVRQRQQRHDQFGEAVSLLERRVAGEDEAVDAEGHVLMHALGHGFGVAHQGGAGALVHGARAAARDWG